MLQTLTDLVTKKLDDIYVVGFIDDDESPSNFKAQLWTVYLEISGRLFAFQCIEDTGTIKIIPCLEISGSPFMDDDYTPGTMSIRELILAAPDAENRIKELRLWGASFGDEAVICSAAQLELDSGQVLFIDPSNHFGFRFGGKDQRNTWLRTWPSAASAFEWSTKSVA